MSARSSIHDTLYANAQSARALLFLLLSLTQQEHRSLQRDPAPQEATDGALART